MSDSDIFGLLDYLFEEFNKRNLAFVEINEALSFDPRANKDLAASFWADKKQKSICEIYKPKFTGVLI